MLPFSGMFLGWRDCRRWLMTAPTTIRVRCRETAASAGMAETCIDDTDSAASCGKMSMRLENLTKNQDFIVNLRLQRQAGGTCSWANAPIVLQPGNVRTETIPTLAAAGAVPGNSDPVSRFSAFRPTSRRALLVIETIRVSTQGSISAAELADDGAGIFASVDGKVDWDTHHISTVSINGCDDTSHRSVVGKVDRFFVSRGFEMMVDANMRREATSAADQPGHGTVVFSDPAVNPTPSPLVPIEHRRHFQIATEILAPLVGLFGVASILLGVMYYYARRRYGSGKELRDVKREREVIEANAGLQLTRAMNRSGGATVATPMMYGGI